jgi:hypothetical protein
MASSMSDAERLYLKSTEYKLQEIPPWNSEEMKYNDHRRMVIDLNAQNAVIEQKAAKYRNKAIALFDRMCLSAQLSPEEKSKIFETYHRCIPDQASELLTRFRDMIPHLRTSTNFSPLVDFLQIVATNPNIDNFMRLCIAVTFYNNYLFNVCYKLFTEIAFDEKSVGYACRVDACRYLFASEEHIHVSTSQEILISIIEDMEIDSSIRYGIIASFISKTGINTMSNFGKLKVKYNEPFVAGLQTIFFYNLENGVRERILSGQHLLQMTEDTISEEEKTKIMHNLLDIAKDESLEDNARADAADVVMRLGTEELKHLANQIIREMGMGKLSGGMRNKGTIMDSSATIYSNSQNTHSFSDQTTTIMEELVVNTIANKEYAEIYDELIVLVKKYATGENGKIDNSIKFRAMKALTRVNQDTATFTKYNITLSTLLVLVWCRIESYDDTQIQEELKKRLVQELIDMGETCSTGHADRFVNVLSGYEFTLKVSWEEQLISNIVGRMNARMRDCNDLEIRETLEIARTELASEEEKEVYKKFIETNLEELKLELYSEFVEENHLTEEEFEVYFTKGGAQLQL